MSQIFCYPYFLASILLPYSILPPFLCLVGEEPLFWLVFSVSSVFFWRSSVVCIQIPGGLDSVERKAAITSCSLVTELAQGLHEDTGIYFRLCPIFAWPRSQGVTQVCVFLCWRWRPQLAATWAQNPKPLEFASFQKPGARFEHSVCCDVHGGRGVFVCM